LSIIQCSTYSATGIGSASHIAMTGCSYFGTPIWQGPLRLQRVCD